MGQMGLTCELKLSGHELEFLIVHMSIRIWLLYLVGKWAKPMSDEDEACIESPLV